MPLESEICWTWEPAQLIVHFISNSSASKAMKSFKNNAHSAWGPC